jgi:hypothetical protein
MARFNRTFYDLNNERHYCFAVSDESIPSVLSDLKLSVPNYTSVPFISGIFIRENTVQITIVSDGKLVASYSSDSRSMLRHGRTVPLKSWKEGYEGMLVFGNLKNDVHYRGTIPISEECLTRYQPSAIHYVSIPCTDIRLTGEVFIGGDSVHTMSSCEKIPTDTFGIEHSMILDILDTGTADATNPMILYANGVNALNEIRDIRSPIYTIYGIRPNAEGTVFVHFEDHFRIAAVVNEISEKISEVAVGTSITQDIVCYPSPREERRENEEENCPVDFITINYG